MRKILLFGVALTGLAVAAGAFVSAGSAQGRSDAGRYVLTKNNRFEVAGSRIVCGVLQKQAGNTPRLLCYRSKLRGKTPLVGSYEVELTETGVGVARVGDRRFVFSKAEVAPHGAPAGSARAKLVFGGVAQLRSRSERVYVAGTNIVCRLYNASLRAVLCVSMGRDGRVHDGTYLVWITNRGVVVAQARQGKAVVVFQRVHGH
jgi:hypothetical protein